MLITLLSGISGLVAEYIVAIDVTRVRFPADANLLRKAKREALRKLVHTHSGICE